jgi:hypothetical protein
LGFSGGMRLNTTSGICGSSWFCCGMLALPPLRGSSIVRDLGPGAYARVQGLTPLAIDYRPSGAEDCGLKAPGLKTPESKTDVAYMRLPLSPRQPPMSAVTFGRLPVWSW